MYKINKNILNNQNCLQKTPTKKQKIGENITPVTFKNKCTPQKCQC